MNISKVLGSFELTNIIFWISWSSFRTSLLWNCWTQTSRYSIFQGRGVGDTKPMFVYELHNQVGEQDIMYVVILRVNDLVTRLRTLRGPRRWAQCSPWARWMGRSTCMTSASASTTRSVSRPLSTGPVTAAYKLIYCDDFFSGRKAAWLTSHSMLSNQSCLWETVLELLIAWNCLLTSGFDNNNKP